MIRKFLESLSMVYFKTTRHILWPGLFLLFFCSLADAAFINQCSRSSVALEGDAYLVSPSGGDDTSNIQCAFDSAIDQGIPKIKLSRGSFQISSISATDFRGSFEGLSAKATIIKIEDYTMDCSREKGRPIMFLGGSVTVKKMGIEVTDPCYEGANFTLITFFQESCEDRTHFAVVDRISIVGSLLEESMNTAIAFAGTVENGFHTSSFSYAPMEDVFIGSCESQGLGPLGTFKVNRTEISGFGLGIYSTVWGGGQVDINYNEITAATGVLIYNANQSTTITGNTINYASEAFQLPDYDSDMSYEDYGIFVFQSEDSWAPRSNRTVIHNNTLSQGTDILHEGGALAAIYILDVVPLNHTVIASNNKITSSNLFAITAWPIYFEGNSGFTVTGNTLRGNGYSGITVTSVDDDVRGGTITSNNFPGNFVNWSEDSDILLFQFTENIIIGPQGADTVDYGDNYVLN